MSDFLEPPEVWYLWDGERLYLPYPGSNPTGLREVCDNIIAANPGKGYQAVQMELTFAEEGHECVWEFTHAEPNFGSHYECKICEAKSP